MNGLGCWTPETDEQRTQRYCAEQIAMTGAQSADELHWVAAGMRNAMAFRGRTPPQFYSIDPKSKLSPKAARLLSANHCLVQS